MAREIAENGLVVSDIEGRQGHPGRVTIHTDPACLAGSEIILVAVKSGATGDIAAQIAAHAPTAIVVSLQNGVSNADVLRAALPGADVRGAVVGYNVVRPEPGCLHQATSGGIWLEDASGALGRELSVPGLAIRTVADIRPVQWGKLLVNLNNALNALSGLTLLEQLQDRGWRRLLADQMAETLSVLRAAGIRPARVAAAPPALVPYLLRLPTPVFRRVARTMLTIDPSARSSMQDDLRARRRTEVDALQGAVLRLAKTAGLACPTIEAVSQAVAQAEAQDQGPPGLGPEDVTRG